MLLFEARTERDEFRGRRKNEGRRRGMALDLWPPAATLAGRSGDLGNGFGRRGAPVQHGSPPPGGLHGLQEGGAGSRGRGRGTAMRWLPLGSSEDEGSRGDRGAFGIGWRRKPRRRGSGRIPMCDLSVAAARRKDGTSILVFRVAPLYTLVD